MRIIWRAATAALMLAAAILISGEGSADPANTDGQAPTTGAEAAPPDAQATLNLSASLTEGGAPLNGGLRWRLFRAQADADGSHEMIRESNMAQPTLVVPPGYYVVHVSLGLASATKRLTLGPEVRSDRLLLSAGGLRVQGTLADALIDPSKLSLSIYVPEGRNPQAKLIYAKAKAGDIIALPEGTYHIVSTYLDTVGGRFLVSAAINSGKSAAPAPPAVLPSNSIVNADIKVSSGKLTDVTLRHRCATLTLKLVSKAGGEARPNTTFTVLTPGGDVIRELMGAFPSLVLAEGEYVVIARHDAKTYQSTFEVHSGMDRDVEVLAQENGRQENGKEAPQPGKERPRPDADLLHSD